MPNPYYEDPDRGGSRPQYTSGDHPQQYRRGDALFQFPLWAIIVAFCVGMWPVGVAFIILNRLVRSGAFNWEPRRPAARPAARAAAPAASAPAKPAKQESPRTEETKITVLAIIGCVLLGVGVLASVSGLHDMIFYGGREYWDLYLEDALGGLLMLTAGGGFCFGAHTLRTNRRMRRKIDNIVGDADHVYIRDIAAAIPCTQDKCIRHLENCIDKGVFGEDAYIDMRTRCLVVRGEAPKPEPKPKRKKKEEPAPAPKEMSQYEKTLAHLRGLSDAIPDEEMKAKIVRLEKVTGKIFEQAQSDPDKRPQMRKFMDYYLPTSIKLLDSYAEMEAQGIEGENISESKRRIEAAMDTMVTAFENQLDKLFQSDALDLSTDIDVMERMLQADGLTGSDPFGLKDPEPPVLEL